MKLRHLIPLCFLALSPLAAAQELSATAVAEQLEQTATELAKESAQAVKKLKKDKKATKSARREAKKEASSAKKRAAMLRALANRLRDIEGGHASVDEADGKGNTALMLAAVLGEKDAAAWLMNKGANTELKNARGKTVAELCQNEDVVNLIRMSTPPTDWDDVIARLGGSPELIEACTKVKEGGDINAENGKLFCDMISYYSHDERKRKFAIPLAKFLISKGADINAGKGAVLDMAVKRACNEMVILLLAEGADPTLGDKISRFGEHLNLINTAALFSRLPGGPDAELCAEVISTLLQHEAIKHKIDKEPFYLVSGVVDATIGMSKASTKVLDVLLPACPNSHAVDRAFSQAAGSGKPSSLSMCEYLNDKGVSPAGYDEALYHASYKPEERIHEKECMLFILEKGKPTQKGKDEALKRAMRDKRDKTAETLRQHGAMAP